MTVTGATGNLEEQTLSTKAFFDRGKKALYGNFEQTDPGAARVNWAARSTDAKSWKAIAMGKRLEGDKATWARVFQILTRRCMFFICERIPPGSSGIGTHYTITSQPQMRLDSCV